MIKINCVDVHFSPINPLPPPIHHLQPSAISRSFFWPPPTLPCVRHKCISPYRVVIVLPCFFLLTHGAHGNLFDPLFVTVFVCLVPFVCHLILSLLLFPAFLDGSLSVLTCHSGVTCWSPSQQRQMSCSKIFMSENQEIAWFLDVIHHSLYIFYNFLSLRPENLSKIKLCTLCNTFVYLPSFIVTHRNVAFRNKRRVLYCWRSFKQIGILCISGGTKSLILRCRLHLGRGGWKGSK